jgi:MFS transporter, PPP family, 3-phenylpropionic acid transporter
MGSAFHMMRTTLFVYFLGFGVFLPFFSPFLKAQGFDAQQVGGLLAAVMLAKVFGPLLLGWWVDRSNRLLPVLRSTALFSVLLFGVVIGLTIFSAPFALWFVVLLLFGLVWQPILSQLDVLTLRLVADDSNAYSAIRAWGSIGFIVASVGLGWVINGFVEHKTALISGFMWLSLLGLLALLLLMPELKTTHAPSVRSAQFWPEFWRHLRRPPMLGFLSMQFLVNVAHGVYYAFFSIYLDSKGYSAGMIGLLWALGVVAEIVLFFILPRFLGRYALSTLFLLAIVLMALRWVMIGTLIDSLFWLLLAQILHAASFGLTHAVGIAVMHQQFSGGMQARGQAIFSGLSYGGGAATGLLLAGYLWAHIGATGAFLAMALVSVLAGVMWFTCRRLMDHAPTFAPGEVITDGV